MCFNHFGKVTIYLIKFKTIFEEINPSISGKICDTPIFGGQNFGLFFF